MPAANNKNKQENSGTGKNAGNKSTKSSTGLLNVVPTAKARDRVKERDFKRRKDAESNGL